jgi:hypothetical protein
LHIEKAFDKTEHLGLLYKLSNLKFSISLLKVIITFLSQKKFRVSVEGEISAPRGIQAGVPQGSVLSPTWHTPQTPGVSLGLFASNTSILVYVTDRREGYVFIKLQRGLSAIER